MRKFLQWRIYTDLFTPRVNNNFAISTELLLGVCFNIVSINIPIIQCPLNILIFAISIRGHFVSQFHLSNKSFAICPRMFFNNLVSMHFIFKMIKPITSRNFCVSVFTNTILRIRIFEVKALSGQNWCQLKLRVMRRSSNFIAFVITLNYSPLLKEKHGVKRDQAIIFGNIGGNNSMAKLQGKIWEGIKVQGYFSVGRKFKVWKRNLGVLKIWGELRVWPNFWWKHGRE